MNVTLRPGRWYAGIDTPFMASDGMIIAKLKSHGFTNVQLHERDEAPLPTGVKPSSDNWDKWGSADYAGGETTVELHPAVSWIIPPARTTGPLTPSTPTTPKSSSKTTIGNGAVLAILLLAWSFL